MSLDSYQKIELVQNLQQVDSGPLTNYVPFHKEHRFAQHNCNTQHIANIIQMSQKIPLQSQGFDTESCFQINHKHSSQLCDQDSNYQPKNVSGSDDIGKTLLSHSKSHHTLQTVQPNKNSQLATSYKPQTSVQHTTKKQPQSSKLPKQKLIQIQRQLLDKFINQNLRLKTTIKDLKVITLKLKKNEQIFKEGRLIQKGKIQKLVQEIEKKKVKLVEKDLIIEGLTFDLEKLALKIQALENYKDLHSPIYMSMLKKDIGKPLSIDPNVHCFSLNLVNFLQAQQQPQQIDRRFSQQCMQAQQITLQPNVNHTPQMSHQLELQSNTKLPSKRCHQCDIYFEQNRELKLKLLNNSAEELHKQIFRLQQLQGEKIKIINHQAAKIGKIEAMSKETEMELDCVKRINLQLRQKAEGGKSDSQLQKQLTEVQLENQLLTKDLTNLQQHCQQLYTTKQQLEQKLHSLIPELQSQLNSWKCKAKEDQEMIGKLRNELMNEKVLHNDVENMLRDELAERDQVVTDIKEELEDREKGLREIRREVGEWEDAMRQKEERMRLLERELREQREKVLGFKQEVEMSKKRIQEVEIENVEEIEVLKRQIKQLQVQLNQRNTFSQIKSTESQMHALNQNFFRETKPNQQHKSSQLITIHPPQSQNYSTSKQPSLIYALNIRVHQLQLQNKHLSDLLQSISSERRISVQNEGILIKGTKLLSEDIHSRKQLSQRHEYHGESKRTIRSEDDSEEGSLEHVDAAIRKWGSPEEPELANSCEVIETNLLESSRELTITLEKNLQQLPSLSVNLQQLPTLQVNLQQFPSLQVQLQNLTQQLMIQKAQRIQLQGQNQALKLTLSQKSQQIFDIKSQLQQLNATSARNSLMEQLNVQMQTEISYLNKEKKKLLNTIIEITSNITTINNDRDTSDEGSNTLIKDNQHALNHVCDIQSTTNQHTKPTELPSLILSLKDQISTSLYSVKKLTKVLQSKKTLLSTKQVPSVFVDIHKQVPSAFADMHKHKHRPSINDFQQAQTLQKGPQNQQLFGSNLTYQVPESLDRQPFENREESFKQLIRSVGEIQEGVKNFVMKSHQQIHSMKSIGIMETRQKECTGIHVVVDLLAKLATAQAVGELIIDKMQTQHNFNQPFEAMQRQEHEGLQQLKEQTNEYYEQQQAQKPTLLNNNISDHLVQQSLISHPGSALASAKKLTLSKTQYHYSIIGQKLQISQFKFDHEVVRAQNQGMRLRGRQMIDQLKLFTKQRKETHCIYDNQTELTELKQINDELQNIIQEMTSDDDQNQSSSSMNNQEQRQQMQSQHEFKQSQSYQDEKTQEVLIKQQHPSSNSLLYRKSSGNADKFLTNNQQQSYIQSSKHHASNPNIKGDDSSINNRSSNQRCSHASSNSQENQYIAMIGEMERELQEIKDQLKWKLGLEEENQRLRGEVKRLSETIDRIIDGQNQTEDKQNLQQKPLNPITQEQDDLEEECSQPNTSSLDRQITQQTNNNAKHPLHTHNASENHSFTSLDQVHNQLLQTTDNIAIPQPILTIQDKLSTQLQNRLQTMLITCTHISAYVQNYEQLPPASLGSQQSLIESLISTLTSFPQSLCVINDMYLAIKYRLKLLKKLQSEKYLHLETQEKEIFQLKQDIQRKEQFIQAQKDKIQHMKLCESKNQEMLIQNIQITKTNTELKAIIEKYREKILHYEQTEKIIQTYADKAKLDKETRLDIVLSVVNQCIHNENPIPQQQPLPFEPPLASPQTSRLSQLTKLNLSNSAIHSNEPVTDLISINEQQKPKLPSSVDAKFTLEFMKQLLLEMESIEESVIAIETEMQKNYHLLKSFMKKKNLLIVTPIKSQLGKQETGLTGNKQLSSMTSILQPNCSQSSQQSLIASEYSKIVKQLQLKLQENERMMQHQKMKVHQEFTQLMNHILLLQQGEHISRDRFRGYLERVRGVNDGVSYRVGQKVQCNQRLFSANKIDRETLKHQQLILFQTLVSQLQQITHNKRQTLKQLPDQQSLTSSVQMYITTKWLQQQKWFNHNSTIEYESQQSIIEDDNESESESQVKDVSGYTDSQQKRSCSEYTDSIGRNESSSTINNNQQDRRPQPEIDRAYTNVQVDINSQQMPYKTFPKTIYPHFTSQRMQPDQMYHSVQLMEVSLNNDQPDSQGLYHSREVND